ncbi:MAG: response regulator [Verrucomicrobiales bacterium]|nr:response regulator [Verrucomicrobiales bacterium]
MNPAPPTHRRILLVDDNTAIHEDFHKILVGREAATADIDQAAALFFGDQPNPTSATRFDLTCATQGEEALLQVQSSLAAHTPFALAFVDMRMPPGWDGLETIRQLWQADPHLEVVLCTAYSDHSWLEIQAGLGTTDRLLILKKPFDTMEVQQMALALTEKWHLRQRTESRHASAEAAQRRHTQAVVETHQAQLQCVTDRLRALIPPVHDLLASAMTLETTRRLDQVQGLARQLRRDGETISQLARDLQRLAALHIGPPLPGARSAPLLASCQRAIEASAIVAGLKGLRIQVETPPGPPPTAAGDPDALGQLLLLLVDMAVRRVDEGTVRIKFESRAEANEIDVFLLLPRDTPPLEPYGWDAQTGPSAMFALATHLASLQGGTLAPLPPSAKESAHAIGVVLTLPLGGANPVRTAG